MIDYRTHLVSLSMQITDLTAQPLADPGLAAKRAEQISDVQAEPGLAALGALIDHLFRHASSDGAELDLLERAAALWAEGLDLYTSIGSIRADIETALSHPASPDSAAVFCAATTSLRGLAAQMQGKHDQIAALGDEVKAMKHMPEHPRQLDLKIGDWPWGDLFLARRTDAFVRAAFARAATPAQRSFAFGVLSSLTANSCASPYLTQVVGGPRRSHRFRDRIAANTLGSWFAQTRPEVQQCADIANRIRFGAGGQPELPADLEVFLTTIVGDTYDPAAAPPLPDLQAGYRRLIRHLEVLDRFRLPAEPAPLLGSIVVQLYADPANPPAPTITPETATPPSGHGPGVKPTNYGPGAGSTSRPTKTDSSADSDSACGSFWLGVLAFIAWAALLGGPCWEEWGSGKHCKFWDKHVSDNFQRAFTPDNLTQAEKDALASQHQALTSNQFAVAAGVPQLTELAGQLFDFQKNLWEALGKAKAFLAGCGLVYPDGQLSFPLYQQFLTTPVDTSRPHRPEPDPAPNFYRYPPTPIEDPADNTGILPTDELTALLSRSATPVWTDIGSGAAGVVNPDLDADRAAGHKCWATSGSINDNPVGVLLLGYPDM